MRRAGYLPTPLHLQLARYGPLCDTDVAVLTQAVAETQAVEAGRELRREDVESPAWAIVISGLAVRWASHPDGRRQAVAFVLPGDVCRIPQTGRASDIEHLSALAPSRMTLLSDAKFVLLRNTSNALTRAFGCLQARDNAILERWLLRLGCRSAIASLSHLLCELYVRMDAAGEARQGECDLPVTQGDLASALAITPIHLNRVVQELRHGGLAQLRRQRLAIVDFEALKQVGAFDSGYLLDQPAGCPEAGLIDTVADAVQDRSATDTVSSLDRATEHNARTRSSARRMLAHDVIGTRRSGPRAAERLDASKVHARERIRQSLERTTAQELRTRRLQSSGYDARLALSVLATMRESLALQQASQAQRVGMARGAFALSHPAHRSCAANGRR